MTSSLSLTSRLVEYKWGREVGVIFHCDPECLDPSCSFLAAEAWERQTFGGAKIEIYPQGSPSSAAVAPHMFQHLGQMRLTHWYDR